VSDSARSLPSASAVAGLFSGQGRERDDFVAVSIGTVSIATALDRGHAPTHAAVSPFLSLGALLDLQAIVIDGNLPLRLVALLGAWLMERRAGCAVRTHRDAWPPPLRLGAIGPNAAARGAAILLLLSGYDPEQERVVRPIGTIRGAAASGRSAR